MERVWQQERQLEDKQTLNQEEREPPPIPSGDQQGGKIWQYIKMKNQNKENTEDNPLW